MQKEREQEPEETTASRPTVAELAGRFKGASPTPARETEKPARRRPPCSLKLPKPHGDEHERPTDVTSPVKTKRNSALIEKLQANLALSPSALLPSPKSPGFRLLPHFSPPSSPGPTTESPSSTVTPSNASTSLVTEEEGPVSFEAPPTTDEGSLLLNVNKSRARHSLRRRPPSRRHRKSSSGEEVGVATEELETPTSQLDHKTTKGEGRDVFSNTNGDDLEEDLSDQTPKEDQSICEIQEERREDENQHERDQKEGQGGVSVEEDNLEKASEEDPNNNKEEENSIASTCQSR
ncbi:duboraya [Syngnathoides biaculeatus]|uniref:duboraya n=1 Tax=Syngnathoides biaculeatus TaxID=300417 RepID=UPI002ADDD828|nr:duboraya [Syngnathoides biaculeatus]XP_061659671.1 duboraya [Syngnathoides biaculeatus]